MSVQLLLLRRSRERQIYHFVGSIVPVAAPMRGMELFEGRSVQRFHVVFHFMQLMDLLPCHVTVLSATGCCMDGISPVVHGFMG